MIAAFLRLYKLSWGQPTFHFIFLEALRNWPVPDPAPPLPRASGLICPRALVLTPTGPLRFRHMQNATKAPKPPAAYKSYPKLNFLPGAAQGLVAVVKYTNASAFGAYSELLYIPGLYNNPSAPCVGSLASMARLWVDNAAAMEAGRCIWGLPKVGVCASDAMASIEGNQ